MGNSISGRVVVPELLTQLVHIRLVFPKTGEIRDFSEVLPLELFKGEYENIRSKFEEKYGCSPTFFARAPGRVNLIGEHIDYCGYGVLPMAIEQDIVIAVCKTDKKELRLANTNPKYQDFQCDILNYEISKDKPVWHNYFLCGLRGMTEMLSLSEPAGMWCMVEGTIPSSAGLSSSSAMVCCAALVTMHANGASKTKKEIADMCASCERYIGTQGGGMDQAISLMAQPGFAKKIDFNPLREKDVKLPDGVTFVISNCCVKKNKAASSDFNTRVVECRLATQILAKSKSLDWREYKKLGPLQEKLGLSLLDMEELVKDVLHDQVYSKEKVCEMLEVTPEELATTSLSANTLDVDQFKLYDRAMHVYSEAQRVEDFYQTCISSPPDAVKKLGDILNHGHHSCSQVYECSCHELDELVSICRISGAVGSRLTGAGWGGCAVSMVPTDQLKFFMDNVRAEYYEARGLVDEVDQALFATKPGGGAVIYNA